MKIGKDSVRIAMIDYKEKQIRYLKEYFTSYHSLDCNCITCKTHDPKFVRYCSFHFGQKGNLEPILVYFHDALESSEKIMQFEYTTEKNRWKDTKGNFTINPSKVENEIHQLFSFSRWDDAVRTGYPIPNKRHPMRRSVLGFRLVSEAASMRGLSLELRYLDGQQNRKVKFIFEQYPYGDSLRETDIYDKDAPPIPFKVIEKSNENSKGKRKASEEEIIEKSSTESENLISKPSKLAKVSITDQSTNKEQAGTTTYNESFTQTESDKELSSILQQHILESKELQDQINSIQSQVELISNKFKEKETNKEDNYQRQNEELMIDYEKELKIVHDKYKEEIEKLKREKEESLNQIKKDCDLEKKKIMKDLEQLEQQKVEKDLDTLREMIYRQTSSSSALAVIDE